MAQEGLAELLASGLAVQRGRVSGLLGHMSVSAKAAVAVAVGAGSPGSPACKAAGWTRGGLEHAFHRFWSDFGTLF